MQSRLHALTEHLQQMDHGIRVNPSSTISRVQIRVTISTAYTMDESSSSTLTLMVNGTREKQWSMTLMPLDPAWASSILEDIITTQSSRVPLQRIIRHSVRTQNSSSTMQTATPYGTLENQWYTTLTITISTRLRNRS